MTHKWIITNVYSAWLNHRWISKHTWAWADGHVPKIVIVLKIWNHTDQCLHINIGLMINETSQTWMNFKQHSIYSVAALNILICGWICMSAVVPMLFEQKVILGFCLRNVIQLWQSIWRPTISYYFLKFRCCYITMGLASHPSEEFFLFKWLKTELLNKINTVIFWRKLYFRFFFFFVVVKDRKTDCQSSLTESIFQINRVFMILKKWFLMIFFISECFNWSNLKLNLKKKDWKHFFFHLVKSKQPILFEYFLQRSFCGIKPC